MPPRIYTDVVTIGTISVYQVTADPNGVLDAPLGSLATRDDTAGVYVNSDGATAWTLLGSGGYTFENATFRSGVSPDLALEATNNVVIEILGSSGVFVQDLPSAAGARNHYRLLFLGGAGEAPTLQLNPTGGDSIGGAFQLFGYNLGTEEVGSAVTLISNGVDTWYGFY